MRAIKTDQEGEGERSKGGGEKKSNGFLVAPAMTLRLRRGGQHGQRKKKRDREKEERGEIRGDPKRQKGTLKQKWEKGGRDRPDVVTGQPRNPRTKKQPSGNHNLERGGR